MKFILAPSLRPLKLLFLLPGTFSWIPPWLTQLLGTKHIPYVGNRLKILVEHKGVNEQYIMNVMHSLPLMLVILSVSWE